jgi:hypothetical protein
MYFPGEKFVYSTFRHHKLRWLRIGEAKRKWMMKLGTEKERHGRVVELEEGEIGKDELTWRDVMPPKKREWGS